MDFSYLKPYLRYVTSIDYFAQNADFVVGCDNRIFYILGGKIFIIFKDERILLEPSSLVLIKAGTRYRLENIDGKTAALIVLNFDMRESRRTKAELIRPVPEAIFKERMLAEKEDNELGSDYIIIKEAAKFRESLVEITREFSVEADGYREKSRAILTSVLISVLRTANNRIFKEAGLVTRVREYLHDNFEKEIDADIIAEEFHYHPNYVGRVFKENTGGTVHRALIEIRIEKAKKMIVSTNRSLEEISLLCGFKTHSHFSQTFKKFCGISPQKYKTVNDKIIL